MHARILAESWHSRIIRSWPCPLDHHAHNSPARTVNRSSDMPTSSINRRGFNRASLMSLLAAAGVDEAAAQPRAPATGQSRREVIKQELPGEPARELLLIEVGYAPGAGSPAHLHANGVMAFVVSGAIASKVNDGQVCWRAGAGRIADLDQQ